MSDNIDIVQRWQDNFNDELDKDEDERTFFGRDALLDKLCHFVKSNKRIIQVHGFKEIGKSRVVLYALKRLYSEDGYHFCYQNFKDRSTCRFRKEIFELSEEPSAETYGEHLAHVQKQLKTEAKNVVLFLDNVDEVIESAEQKEMLQDFIRKTCKTCRNICIIFSTTTQIQFTEKGFVSMEIPAMEFEDSMQLFLEVIGERPTFSEEMVYIQAIVKLLGDIPKAVMLAGCELCEGIFKVSEILELLISHLSEMLSREEFPADDRVGDTMRNVSNHTGEHMTALNSNMTGSEFTITQSLNASSDRTETEAVHKLKKLLPLVRKCIVGTDKLATDQTFTLNNILREYIDLKNNDAESRRRIKREKAERIGLNTNGGDISDQRILAECILKMGDQSAKKASDDEEERSDDSGTCNDLDSGEETNDLSVTASTTSENSGVPSDEFGRLSVHPIPGHPQPRLRYDTHSSSSKETSDNVNVRRSVESTTSSLSGPPALQFESMGMRVPSGDVSYDGDNNFEGLDYIDGDPNIVYCDDSQEQEASSGSLHTRGTVGGGKNYNIHADTFTNQVSSESIEDNKYNDNGACGTERTTDEKKMNGSPRGPPARKYSPPVSRSGSTTEAAGGPKLTRQPSEHDSNIGENLNTGEEKNLLRNKSVDECT